MLSAHADKVIFSLVNLFVVSLIYRDPTSKPNMGRQKTTFPPPYSFDRAGLIPSLASWAVSLSFIVSSLNIWLGMWILSSFSFWYLPFVLSGLSASAFWCLLLILETYHPFLLPIFLLLSFLSFFWHSNYSDTCILGWNFSIGISSNSQILSLAMSSNDAFTKGTLHFCYFVFSSIFLYSFLKFLSLFYHSFLLEYSLLFH